MIPFLVKLANLLDDRGQYKMAREVDDLIQKFAQQTHSPEQLIQNYQDLNRQVQEASARWQEAQQAWQAQPQRDELLTARDEARKQLDALWDARDKAKKELNDDSQKGLTRLQNKPAPEGVASKEVAKPQPKPQKKPQQPNALVQQIQKNLGLDKQDGIWGPKTNKAFIAAMNSIPEYAKMMVGGKFNGTLEEAVNMTMQLASLRDQQPSTGAASKAPAAAPAVKQEDDKEVPPTNGPFGGPGRR